MSHVWHMISCWKKQVLLHKDYYTLFVFFFFLIFSWQEASWKNKWLTTVSQQGVIALIHIIVKCSGEETPLQSDFLVEGCARLLIAVHRLTQLFILTCQS